MKRLLFLFLLIGVIAWVGLHRVERRRAAERMARGHAHVLAPRIGRAPISEPPRGVSVAISDERDDEDDEFRHDIEQATAEAQEALHEAAREVHHALDEAANEIRHAADEIPVPILPGTRVVEAIPEPPAPPAPPASPRAPRPPKSLAHKPRAEAGRHSIPPPAPPSPPVERQPLLTREITGLISATEDRARAEARKQLETFVSDSLAGDGVPRSWRPAPRQVDDLVLETRVDPVAKEYGTLYVARLKIDASPERQRELVRSYERQLVGRRMVALGGVLAFVLTCLGAVSAYIRTDEATKGYYTNRLRMLAAAGVGATGVVIYQMIG